MLHSDAKNLGCGDIKTEWPIVIRTPNYPKPFPRGYSDCVWNVVPPKDFFVQLNFITFEVGFCSNFPYNRDWFNRPWQSQLTKKGKGVMPKISDVSNTILSNIDRTRTSFFEHLTNSNMFINH